MAIIEKEIELVGSKGEHELIGLFDSGAVYYGGRKMSRKIICLLVPLILAGLAFGLSLAVVASAQDKWTEELTPTLLASTPGMATSSSPRLASEPAIPQTVTDAITFTSNESSSDAGDWRATLAQGPGIRLPSSPHVEPRLPRGPIYGRAVGVHRQTAHPHPQGTHISRADGPPDPHGSNNRSDAVAAAFHLAYAPSEPHIRLEKNEDYYDAAGVVITEVTSLFVDADEAWTRYQSGELDTITPPLSALEEIKASPVYSPQLHVYPRQCTYYYGFSNDVPPFDDPLVRGAFASAIDRKRLISETLSGDQPPALTFTAPGSFGHVDGYAAGIGRPYSPTLAVDFLTASGYTGTPTITLMYNTSGAHQAIAEAVRQMWIETLGITVTLQDMEWGSYLDLLGNGSAEERPSVYRMGWCADYPDANNFLNAVFHSGNALNYARYNNPAYDALVEAAAITPLSTTRLSLYEQAEATLVMTDTVIAPLYYYVNHSLTRPDLARTYRSFSGQHLDEWSFTGDPRPLEIVWGDPLTLDPALAGDTTSINYIEQLFLGLTDFDSETGDVVPELATDWDVSLDGRVYTFTLRSDATWTDGNPVTADDVEYGVLRSLDPATGSDYGPYLLDIIENAQAYNEGTITDPDLVGVEALDATHVRFTLTGPASYFPAIAGLWPARPQPKWAIESHGDGWTDPDNIVTNGPYKLVAWEKAPEVGIWKWNTSGYARPGGVYVYGIYYRNDGEGSARNTLIVDTLPMDTTYAGDTSGLPHIKAGGVITWDLGDVSPGDYGAFMVTLNVPDTMPTGSEVIEENCVFIATTTAGDDDPDNDSSCAGPVDVWDDEVEIDVDKWVDPDDPTPGQEFNYTVRWCNNRGAATGSAWLTDTLPLSTTLLSWSPERWWEVFWTEVITTGGQLVLYAPGLPGDMCEHLNLNLLLDADVPISTTLENTVVVDTPGDVDPDNNWRFHDDAHVSPARYDVRLNKEFHRGVPVPGGWINYFIWYGNDGNIATHVWVTDTMPNGLSYEYAHWGGGDQPQADEPLPDPTIIGNQLVWDLSMLPVGESRWFHIQMNITDTLSPGEVITNCATIGVDGDETTPDNNTSCYPITLNEPGPNLRVTKEHEWDGDGQLDYEITFENIGDQMVYNVWLTDTYPVSTTTANWPNWDYGQQINVTDNYTDSQWIFEIEELQPGWQARIWFDVDLDVPGEPLRWYTNTVEIDTPPGEITPDDNSFTDVAFSGGEVDWVDLDVYRTRIWGCAYSTPITITSAHAQMVIDWDNCWDEEFADPFQPGDVVTVAAGAATHPVVILVPDPFTAYASSITDTVWGQIDHLDHGMVEVDLWGFPTQHVQTDGSGNYSATFLDVPRGAQGDVNYWTDFDYADIGFHRRFQTPDLILRVYYGDDKVDGNYEVGHTGWITVTESDGVTIKATCEITTAAWSWWGGGTGFSTAHHQWHPERPDIVPGYWVYGRMDNGYTSTVRVGTINGELDVDADTVSGTIHANWFTQMLNANCGVWEENGPGRDFTVDPDGGSYFCDFGAMGWDLLPGQNVGVQYQEPDGDWVINSFFVPYEPYVEVHQSHDWVAGRTALPDSWVEITLRDGLGEVKGTYSDWAGSDGWFGGWCTEDEHGDCVDIAPGDTVEVVYDGGDPIIVPIIEIAGTVDSAANTITGQIIAGTLPAQGRAEIWWTREGADQDFATDGAGNYTVDFSPYDVKIGHWVNIRYFNPDGNQVMALFSELRLDVDVNRDDLDGLTDPGRTVAMTLRAPDGSVKDEATDIANDDGRFWAGFSEDIAPGDTVEAVTNPSTSVYIEDITIDVDVDADTVCGTAPPDAWLHVGIHGGPWWDLAADEFGDYCADFIDEHDIQPGDEGEVRYESPEGHRLYYSFFVPYEPFVRVEQTWNQVGGRTAYPNQSVVITVTNSMGAVKGTWDDESDNDAWFGDWHLYDEHGNQADIVAGDTVYVQMNGDLIVVPVVAMTAEVDAGNDQVWGAAPASSPMRVDGPGYTLDTTTDATGNYDADFSGLADIRDGSFITVWYINPEGNEVGLRRWALQIVGNITQDHIWGRTSPSATVQITVTGSGVKGTATTTASKDGHYSTDVYSGTQRVDLVSGDTVWASANGKQAHLLIGPLTAELNVDTDVVSGTAPPNTDVRVDVWDCGSRWVTSDEAGNYSVYFGDCRDLQLGDGGMVMYYSTPDNHEIEFDYFVPYESFVEVHQTHNWVGGRTPMSDMWVEITVRDGLGGWKGNYADESSGDGWFGGWCARDDDDDCIDIVAGDTVEVVFDGTVITVPVVTMTGEVYPDTDIISGTISGVGYPADVRGEVWVDNGPEVDDETDGFGNYEIDFSPFDVKMGHEVAVWYINPDGNQVGIVRSSLRIAVNIDNDDVWGDTIPNATVNMTLTGSGVKGVATAQTDKDGQYWTEFSSDGQEVDILFGDTINAEVEGKTADLQPIALSANTDVSNDEIYGIAPLNVNVWVEVWDYGSKWTSSDESGYYNAWVGDFVDLEVGHRGEVAYENEDGHWIEIRFSTLSGDLNCDCEVDVADIMQVASKWRMTDEDPHWDPRYDLHGDGVITVVDIMKVVIHWGKTCEGSISGHIFKADGVTVITDTLISVHAHGITPGSSSLGTYVSQTDGSYTITGLAPGTYKVQANNNLEPGYVTKYYNDKSAWDEADTVSVQANQTTSGIDFTLEEAGTVTGHVYVEDNMPVRNACVNVSLTAPDWTQVFGWCCTDDHGSYTIGVLPTGSYYLRTHADCRGFHPNLIDEWYAEGGSTPDGNQATPADVVAGQTTSGIDFALDRSNGNEPVGTTMVSLIRDYNNESNMGNLVTDGMRWKADLLDDGELNGSVDVAFTNPGGLRVDIMIPGGSTLPYTITWGMTFDVMPFGNTVFLMDLTGAQIQTLLDQAATLYKGILQSSGITWKWQNDCRCNTPGTWGAFDVEVGGEPLDPSRVYRVVTNNWLAVGGDGWVTFAEGTNRWDTDYDMQEAVNDYITLNSPISPAIEGRITYVE